MSFQQVKNRLSELLIEQAGQAHCPFCKALATSTETDLPEKVCPVCQTVATSVETMTIPGLGQCERYECGKCSQEFIVPVGEAPNPNTTGNTNGSGTQTFAPPTTPKWVKIACTSTKCRKVVFIPPTERAIVKRFIVRQAVSAVVDRLCEQ